jgi:hypothetical protein
MACCVCVAATMAASRSSSNSSGSVGKELRLCFYGCGLIAEHHVVAVQRCREAGEVELQPPCGKTTRMHDCARAFSNCIIMRSPHTCNGHRPPRQACMLALALHTSTHLCCSFWCGHLDDRSLHLAMHQPFASCFFVCDCQLAEGRASDGATVQ